MNEAGRGIYGELDACHTPVGASRGPFFISPVGGTAPREAVTCVHETRDRGARRLNIDRAIASLKNRLAFAAGALEAWRGSRERPQFTAASARLDMLRLQLEKLARAVRRAERP